MPITKGTLSRNAWRGARTAHGPPAPCTSAAGSCKVHVQWLFTSIPTIPYFVLVTKYSLGIPGMRRWRVEAICQVQSAWRLRQRRGFWSSSNPLHPLQMPLWNNRGWKTLPKLSLPFLWGLLWILQFSSGLVASLDFWGLHFQLGFCGQGKSQQLCNMKGWVCLRLPA